MWLVLRALFSLWDACRLIHTCIFNRRQTMLIQLAHTLQRLTTRLTLRHIPRPISILRPAHTLIRHIHRTLWATTQLHTTLAQPTLTQLLAPLSMDIMECRCQLCLMRSQVTRALCTGQRIMGKHTIHTFLQQSLAGCSQAKLNLCGNLAVSKSECYIQYSRY